MPRLFVLMKFHSLFRHHGCAIISTDFRHMRHEAFVEGCLQSDAECRAGLAAPTTVEGLMSAFDE